MDRLDLDNKNVVLAVCGERLRDTLAAALAPAGFQLRAGGQNCGLGAAALLVVEAGAGDPSAATLSPEAIAAVQASAAGAGPSGAKGGGIKDRSIVLVAGEGAAPEALQGAVRAFARHCAPGVRVNAIAPELAGAAMDEAQVAALAVYLARARTVTGQTLIAGPADSP